MNVNDSSWSLYWREELTRPRRYQISDREVPSDQDRLQGVLRGTRRLDNVVQGRQLSAHECADALTETAGDETKQTATISITAAPTHTKRNKPGLYCHFMQGSRVRYRGCGRVSQRGMSQARAALTGQWTQGAPTSRH